MRFALATMALVIALGLGGYGIAQTTVLNGPEELTATSESDSTAPVTVIGGDTLNSLDGRQDLRISGADTIFAAYARTDDVLAWVGDAEYNSIGFDAENTSLVSTTRSGAEATVPSPVGSDLWLAEYTGENELEMKLRLDETFSVLVVSDGVEPAPSTVSLTWPLDNRTPWAGPLMAGGGLMLLISLLLFASAIANRRRRGPRRRSIDQGKPPRLPQLPRQRSYRVTKSTTDATPGDRGSIGRMIAVVPMLLVGTLVLSGCSSALWPDLAGRDAIPLASPSASPTAEPVEEREPAATVRQVKAIVSDAGAVAATADAALDADALATRFDGPALTLRAGNYAIKAKDKAFPGIAAFPTGDLAVTLPQSLPKDADAAWPRSIFAVVTPAEDDAAAADAEETEAAAPVALVLVQNTPREQYKVYYSVTLGPDAVLPELASQTVGAPRLSPDTKLLSMAPETLPAAYVDVITLGEKSEYYDLFDIEKDRLLPSIGVEARADRKAAFNKKTENKAKLVFGAAPGDAETIALASNESGALVSVYVRESERVVPVEDGATINPEGATKTASGVAGTKTGVSAFYGDQLLFYIPPVGSTEKIVLLGFSQVLESAKESK